MNFEFTIEVMAPEEELDAADECYAIYRRDLRLDFVPQIGTIISLKTNFVAGDNRLSTYQDLVHQIDNSALQFVIGEVVVLLGEGSNVDIKLRAADLFESSLQKFRKLGELLTTFYDFDRVV